MFLNVYIEMFIQFLLWASFFCVLLPLCLVIVGE